jgi:DNA-binding NarL/FixJ family response regulator
MRQVFLTPERRALPRWCAAFPELELAEKAPQEPDRQALYWLELGSIADGAEVLVSELVGAGLRVVALSPVPSEAEAFRMLSLGVRGYCHVEAVPEQLQEVADVVARDGLWMPPALVQRLVSVARRVDEGAPRSTHPALKELTHREEQVAVLVGRGHNNREIAEKLGVSERTVKANLTSIFEKLDLRDRVQLALYVNRLPIH